MKTSNKILTVLLVLIFTVPFLLALNLKNKMQKGEYTVKQIDNTKNKQLYRSGSFAPFKAVKVIAPRQDFLTCRISQSDTMSYNYYTNERKDSVAFHTANDTLYIQFVGQKPGENEEERNQWENVTVNVTLPSFANLTVDGAVVVMTGFSMDGITVSLKNKGSIKDGGKGKNKGTVSPVSKTVEAPKSAKASKAVAAKINRKRLFDIEYASLTVPDVNIKDFLIRQVFYRI